MMKTGILAITLFVLASACNRGTDRPASGETADPAETPTAAPHPDPDRSGPLAGSTDVLWDYQFDTISNEYLPIRMRQFDADTLTAEKIEALINRTWPEVQIEHVKTSGDTVFVRIPDSEALTQQMGSAGATQFIVSATYSFTELAGINYVAFSFKEGDHAVPGTYDRSSWDDSGNLAVDID